MATNSREIRRRIKSVKSIGQITKAMELVSAAKMRKAQQAAVASRPYSVLSSELLRRLSKKVDPSTQPLLVHVMPEDMKAPPMRILAIVISSDRGLAGAFTTNLINSLVSLLKKEGAEKFDFITIGKKGADAVRRMKLEIVAAFPAKEKSVTMGDVKPITEIAVGDYLKYKYEKVFVVYTDFVSTLIQKPNILQILPFSPEGNGKNGMTDEDLFEPSEPEVLEKLIAKTIDFAIYQSLVEAAASEHSARMVAMRNANEAAGDLIDDLSLTYNQARQAGITRELAEISAAKLAMEN
jgi:F-type H+-transporting ATPase subunit gamma